MNLNSYIHAFSKLNVNRSGEHVSPHKPVMLLFRTTRCAQNKFQPFQLFELIQPMKLLKLFERWNDEYSLCGETTRLLNFTFAWTDWSSRFPKGL
jgi:hypothetical protein